MLLGLLTAWGKLLWNRNITVSEQWLCAKKESNCTCMLDITVHLRNNSWGGHVLWTQWQGIKELWCHSKSLPAVLYYTTWWMVCIYWMNLTDTLVTCEHIMWIIYYGNLCTMWYTRDCAIQAHWGPRQNGHQFADNIFRCIFFKENGCIRLIFHWSFLFLKIKLTIFQHWFR